MKEEELGEKVERLEQKISRLEHAIAESNSSNKGSLLKKRVLIPVSMLSSIVIATMVFAATIPNSFTSGTTISSSAVNSNFSYIISRLWEVADSSSDLYHTAGNIGIGTKSPSKTLDVSGDVAILGSLDVTGDTVISGKVGIGTATPTEKLVVADDNDADLDLWTANNANTDRSTLHIKFSRGTMANPLDAQPGNKIGSIKAQGYNGKGTSGFSSAASVTFYADAAGTVSSTSMPGTIKFKTTPNNSTTRQTRMTIRSDGKVGIGTSSPTEALDVDSNSIRIRTKRTVDTSADTCDQGEISWDANYIYVCIGTDAWARAAFDSTSWCNC